MAPTPACSLERPPRDFDTRVAVSSSLLFCPLYVRIDAEENLLDMLAHKPELAHQAVKTYGTLLHDCLKP